jgi:hypothetical protein
LRLQVTSEAYSPRLFGGSTRLVFLLNDLEVRCIGHAGELSIEVRTPSTIDWWNSTALLYAYFEKVNSVEDVLNSMTLVRWLASNWEKVHDLLCNPSMREEKKRFEAFQDKLYKARSELTIKGFGDQA